MPEVRILGRLPKRIRLRATDVAAARKKRFGAKTVAEWGEIPYVFEHELESDEYRLAREFTPSCPKCGEGMHTHQSHAVKTEGQPNSNALIAGRRTEA